MLVAEPFQPLNQNKAFMIIENYYKKNKNQYNIN